MRFEIVVSHMQERDYFPDSRRGWPCRVDFNIPEWPRTYTAFCAVKPTAKQLRRMKRFIRGVINAEA